MISPHKRKKEFKHARFHQISTDEVYGSIKTGSFDENSMYKPSSPYSSSKASADLIVNSYFITYGLNTTISISSNNYGKGQNDEKLIPTVINSIISKKTIPVYGDGLNVRDWIHVLDHCAAIDKIFEKSLAGQSYNVAGNEEMSNLQLIKIILDSYNQLTNKYILKDIIEFVDDRFGHDFRYSIVTKKIKNDLLWGPKENFNFRIRELIQTYSNIK